MSLPYVPVKVDVTDYEGSVREIISAIRPTWKSQDVQMEKLTKGYVNCLLKCYVPHEDAIIVRVFGDIPMMNRDTEIELMKLVSDMGIILPMFCRFENGISYGFASGNVLTRKDLENDNVLKSLAHVLHQVHALDVSHILDRAPRPTPVTYLPALWENIMNSDYTDVVNDPRYKAGIPPLEELDECLKHSLDIYKHICDTYPPVFSHGDTHIHNMVYNSDKDQLILLDWEGCQIGPEIMDMAILIDRDPEFSGVFACSESRKKWLQIYLSTHPTYSKEPVTDAVFQQWYRDSLKASMVSAISVVVFFLDTMKKTAVKSDAIGVVSFLYMRYKACELELKGLEDA